MKTIIIAILERESNIPNLFYLPNSFITSDGKFKVIIHSDPSLDIVDSKPVTNFDILITPKRPIAYSSDITTIVHAIKSINVISLIRYIKPIQLMMLQNAVDELGVEKTKFIVPKSVYRGLEKKYKSSYPNQLFLSAGESPTVIKPVNSARGLGQVKLSKDLPPSVITDIIETFKSINDVSEIHPALENKLHNKVSIAENANMEYINEFNQNTGAFFSQDFVENIKTEYRLLVNPNGDIYVHERFRSEGEFQQATGIPPNKFTSKVEHPELIEKSKIKNLNKDLRKILKSIDFTFGSLDLFICEDGKWGIFEFSPEFGMTAFSNDFAVTFHKKAIEFWINKFNLN